MPKPRAGLLSKLRERASEAGSAPDACAAAGALPKGPAASLAQAQATSAAQLRGAKRPSDSSSLATPKAKAKRTAASALSSSSAAGSLARSPGAASSGGDVELGAQCAQVGKECIGCYRKFGIDHSVVAPHLPMVWQYNDGKGQWCRDCTSLFRTAYKPRISASLFERHLCQNQQNRIQWMRMLIAYWSIKAEGASHATLPALESRVKVLSFVFDLLQVPWPSFDIVAPNSEFLKKLGGTDAYLTKSASGEVSGLQLAELPLQTSSSCQRYLVKAQAARQWPLFVWNSLPPSFMESWENDIGDQAFTMLSDMDGATDLQTSSNPTGTGAASSADSPSNPFDFKASGIEQSLDILVESFVSTSLDNSTERDFAPQLVKILKMKQEMLEATSADASLVHRLDVAARVCSACKKMVKPLKDFSKTSKKSILDGMHENLEVVYSYAIGKKFKVSHDFGSAFVQSRFFKLHAESSVPEALAFLKSFPFDRETSEEKACHPAKLANSCIMQVVLESLRRPAQPDDAEAWEKEKRFLLENANLYVEVLRNMVTSLPSLAGSVSALDAYVVILKAAVGTETISPKAVSVAKGFVDSDPQCAHLKQGLSFAGVGLSIATDSDTLIMRGALDDQADADFKETLQTMFSQGMPLVSEAAENTVDVDFTLLAADASGRVPIVHMFSESLESLSRVLASWSPKRVSDEAETLGGMCDQIGLVFTVLDKFRGLQVASAWHSHFAEWGEQAGSLTIESWRPSTAQEVQGEWDDADIQIPNFIEATQSMLTMMMSKAAFDQELQEHIQGLKDTGVGYPWDSWVSEFGGGWQYPPLAWA